MQKDALNHTSINSTIQLVTGKRHGVDVGTTWPILLMNKLFLQINFVQNTFDATL